jgi:hypothetical protein
MAQVEAVGTDGAVDSGSSSGSVDLDRIWSRLPHPTIIALVTWVIGAPIAWIIPTLANVNPFTQRGGNFPLALGGLLLIVVAGFALWRKGPRADAMAGFAVGVFAAYVVLFLKTIVHGTPFGFGGVLGDTGRITAMATRYVHSWAAQDGIVAGRPAEYPPLFPYAVGKLSWVTGIAPWKLMQPAEIFTVSAAVVGGFALWNRIVKAPVAMVIVCLAVGVYGWPTKAYEVVALMVIIPWVLSTFLHDRARMHWVVAGVLGGFVILTYYTYAVFGVFGLIALIWINYRRGGGKDYLVYLAKVIGLALVVSCWFWAPYLWAMLHGGQQLDVYEATEISESPFPFLAGTPWGVAEMGGLLGLLFYRRSTWWAKPLLLMLASAYVYRGLNELRYVLTGHTGLFYYTTPFIDMVLVVAAVLAAAELITRLPANFVPNRQTVVVLIAVALAFTAYDYWYNWAPANTWKATNAGPARPVFADTGQNNRYTQSAHAQYLLNGHHTKYYAYTSGAQGRPHYTPVKQIQQIVWKHFGKNAEPHTLSWTEMVFAYSPWKGYIGVDRGSSYGPVQWDKRFAALQKLSNINDPAEFAQASQHTAFGPIDVFILQTDKKTGTYTWTPLRSPNTLTFAPWQFQDFTVTKLKDGTIVAIRNQ